VGDPASISAKHTGLLCPLRDGLPEFDFIPQTLIYAFVVGIILALLLYALRRRREAGLALAFSGVAALVFCGGVSLLEVTLCSQPQRGWANSLEDFGFLSFSVALIAGGAVLVARKRGVSPPDDRHTGLGG